MNVHIQLQFIIIIIKNVSTYAHMQPNGMASKLHTKYQARNTVAHATCHRPSCHSQEQRQLLSALRATF